MKYMEYNALLPHNLYVIEDKTTIHIKHQNFCTIVSTKTLDYNLIFDQFYVLPNHPLKLS